MNAGELKVILGKHAEWLDGVKGGERANLSGASWGARLYTDARKRCWMDSTPDKLRRLSGLRTEVNRGCLFLGRSRRWRLL